MTADIECKKVSMKEEYLDDLVLRELKAKLKRVLDTEELKLNRSDGGKAAVIDEINSLETWRKRTQNTLQSGNIRNTNWLQEKPKAKAKSKKGCT